MSATTPEDFLAAQGPPYLSAPEPFSPSVFLDLPPTPGRPAADDDADNSDDLVLPFISRMLMEEDIDDKFFYQFPDHPALLTAQQPYAQILSDSATATSSSSDSSSNAAAASSGGGGSGTTGGCGGNSTLSPSSDAPADPAAAWPYDDDPVADLSHLLRSPTAYPAADMGVRLDDFADLLSPAAPGQGDATAGLRFHQNPPFSDDGGGGGGAQRHQSSIDAQNAAAGRAQQRQRGVFQSSAFEDGAAEGDDDDGTKAEATATFPADHAALASAFFGAQNGGNMDMLNLAFRKGMEEAKKFLPTNTSLLIDLDDDTSAKPSLPTNTDSTAFAAATQVKLEEEEQQVVNAIAMFGGSRSRSTNGRGRKNRHAEEDDLEAETGRSSKLMMPEQEETGANELYNEIMTCTYEGFMKRMDDLHIAMDSESEKSARKVSRKGARGNKQNLANEAVDLRTMLIHCAQSVATGDRRSATEVLRQIKQHSSPRGDATQRLAHCFAMGLEARLAGTGSQAYQSLMAQHTSVVEFLKAYSLYMVACCFFKVRLIFSSLTICDAVAGRSKLHIVDYGVQHGFQYPGLFHLLAKMEGGPPEVRLTAIAIPQPGFRPAHQIEETGRRLSNIAREMGVPFKFRGIAAKWEAVCAKDLNIDPDEVLVVNSECYIGNLMDESVLVDSPSPRDMVLNNIREMRPNVFIHTVVNGTYGAPFFLTRFREALFFFSAQFDMIDATIPRDNNERLLIERDMLGTFALNVIACEGADRVERPETYKQWQVRNHRAGLKQLPLNPEVVKAARDKVKTYYHRDFLIDEDNRWLLLGWKGRVLYALSTWVAEDNKPIF